MSGKMPNKLKVLRHRELSMLKRGPRSRESVGDEVCRALVTVLWSPILTKIGTIISLLMSLKVWFGAAGILAENRFERRRRHSSCPSGDFEQTGGRKHNVSLF